MKQRKIRDGDEESEENPDNFSSLKCGVAPFDIITAGISFPISLLVAVHKAFQDDIGDWYTESTK